MNDVKRFFPAIVNGRVCMDMNSGGAYVRYEDHQTLQERVNQLEGVLRELIVLANESEGIAGWHLNGDVVLWEDVDPLQTATHLLNVKDTE